MRQDNPQKQTNTKKSNHTIPRMLLKRFASRSVGDEHYIWQFRQDAKPFETNIKNSSTIAYFYGEPSNGVEDSFSAIETHHSVVLDKILGGKDPGEFEDELRGLVWTLAIRTANFRSNLGELVTTGLGEMIAQADNETIRQRLPGRLDDEFDTMLDEIAGKLPAVQARALRISLSRRPELVAKFRTFADICLGSTDIAGFIQSLLTTVQSEMNVGKLADDAHVRSLEKITEVDHVPDAFRPAHWQVVRMQPQSVILGDGACFAVRGTDEAGHLIRFTKDWDEIYLPIAHDAVLVASRSGQPSLYSLDEINKASATLSYDQFIAARNSDLEQILQDLLRTGIATMSAEEMQQAVREAWSG